MHVTFGKGWQWHNDAGYRTIGYSVAAFQYLYRTGVRKRLNEDWSVASGVAFFYTRSSYEKANHEFGKEFRLWQELAHEKAIAKGWELQNRLRIEQRFFGAVGGAPARENLRGRYRLAITKKLTEKWSIRLADEYMLQRAEQKTNFNQNRLILTGNLQLKNTIQLQSGYMWLRWPSASQHVLLFTFQKNFTLDGLKRSNK